MGWNGGAHPLVASPNQAAVWSLMFAAVYKSPLDFVYRMLTTARHPVRVLCLLLDQIDAVTSMVNVMEKVHSFVLHCYTPGVFAMLHTLHHGDCPCLTGIVGFPVTFQRISLQFRYYTMMSTYCGNITKLMQVAYRFIWFAAPVTRVDLDMYTLPHQK
eukprot:m.1352084 g.1352084  ORF g.1352084 m.1352084 type:complete len:158 (+) comp24923_c0_seq51:662-1135(+)